jgi:hypothetical protein
MTKANLRLVPPIIENRTSLERGLRDTRQTWSCEREHLADAEVEQLVEAAPGNRQHPGQHQV